MLFTVILLWGAVALRWFSSRRDFGRPAGGDSLTSGCAWLAATVTVLWCSPWLAAWTGLANLRALLLRYTIGMAWIGVRGFFVAMLITTPKSNRGMVQSARASSIATAVMMVDASILWLFFIPHDREVKMLNALPGWPATCLLVIQYLWLIAISLDAVGIGLTAARSKVLDCPARTSAVFVTLTGGLGLIAGSEMIGARLIAAGSTAVPAMDILCPISAVLMTCALVSARLVEAVQEHHRARQNIRRMQAEWCRVAAAYPYVVLPMKGWQRWLQAPVVAERMRIEILDGRALARRSG